MREFPGKHIFTNRANKFINLEMPAILVAGALLAKTIGIPFVEAAFRGSHLGSSHFLNAYGECLPLSESRLTALEHHPRAVIIEPSSRTYTIAAVVNDPRLLVEAVKRFSPGANEVGVLLRPDYPLSRGKFDGYAIAYAAYPQDNGVSTRYEFDRLKISIRC